MESSRRARVGEAFRAELGRKDFKKKDLAYALAITPATLRLKIAGRSSFTYDEIAAGASFFGLPMETFVKRIEAGE